MFLIQALPLRFPNSYIGMNSLSYALHNLCQDKAPICLRVFQWTKGQVGLYIGFNPVRIVALNCWKQSPDCYVYLKSENRSTSPRLFPLPRSGSLMHRSTSPSHANAKKQVRTKNLSLTYGTIREPAHFKFNFSYQHSKLLILLFFIKYFYLCNVWRNWVLIFKAIFFDLNSTHQNLGELFHCPLWLKERGLKIWNNIRAKANVYSRLCLACAGPKRMSHCTNSWMRIEGERLNSRIHIMYLFFIRDFHYMQRKRNILLISPP